MKPKRAIFAAALLSAARARLEHERWRREARSVSYMQEFSAGFEASDCRHLEAGRRFTLGRQTLPSLGPAPRQHLAAARGRHARAEAVPPLADEPRWLIGALHAKSPNNTGFAAYRWRIRASQSAVTAACAPSRWRESCFARPEPMPMSECQGAARNMAVPTISLRRTRLAQAALAAAARSLPPWPSFSPWAGTAISPCRSWSSAARPCALRSPATCSSPSLPSWRSMPQPSLYPCRGGACSRLPEGSCSVGSGRDRRGCAATLGAIVIFLIARSALGEPLAARAGPWLVEAPRRVSRRMLSTISCSCASSPSSRFGSSISPRRSSALAVQTYALATRHWHHSGKFCLFHRRQRARQSYRCPASGAPILPCQDGIRCGRVMPVRARARGPAHAGTALRALWRLGSLR